MLFKKISKAIFLATISASLSIGGALAIPNLTSVYAESTAKQPNKEVAKMYRVSHELQFDLKGTWAKLDGKKTSPIKAIVRNNRVFVPLRILTQSKTAQSITWNPKKQEARIVMKDQLVPTWKDLTFKIGSDSLYGLDYEIIPNKKIPKPVLSGGLVYIPASELPMLGISVSAAKGDLTLQWSEKIIELSTKSWETNEGTTTFTMLYQQEMNQPQVMRSIGNGGWEGGKLGKITGRNIPLDGRLYNRIEFTEDLKPGINLMQLTAISSDSATFAVDRRIKDPAAVLLKTSELGGQDVSFSAPTQGYIRAKVGEEITIAGTIMRPNPRFNEITIQVNKYNPEVNGKSTPGFSTVETKKVPIKDDSFTGSISIKEPGRYRVAINSPNYLLIAGSGYVSEQWAELVVEIP